MNIDCVLGIFLDMFFFLLFDNVFLSWGLSDLFKFIGYGEVMWDIDLDRFMFFLVLVI